jgi:hypothetical protein
MIKQFFSKLETKLILATLIIASPLQALAQNTTFNITWNSPLDSQFSGQNGAANLVVAILEALILIAVPIITLMIIYAGFLYVTARGNSEQVARASKALTYAIIGGLLVIGSLVIVELVRQTLCEFRPVGTPGC